MKPQCKQCGCDLREDGKCASQSWHFATPPVKGREITEMPGQEYMPTDLEAQMGLHIIVTGNPVDGFEFYGPFNNGVEATEEGTANLDTDWWTARLLSWDSK